MIYGTAYDESLGDQLRVTVIATGLSPGQARSSRRSAWCTAAAAAHRHRQRADAQPDRCSRRRTGTHDYSGLTTPSVWRNGRTRRRKVDALASNGMDEIEIPAFLRKQAD